MPDISCSRQLMRSGIESYHFPFLFGVWRGNPSEWNALLGLNVYSVIFKDGLAPVTTRGDVIQGIGEFNANRA